MKPVISTLIAAVALAGIAWSGGVSGTSMMAYPDSFLLSFVTVSLPSLGTFVAVIPVLILPVAFVAWHPGLFVGATRLPVRSVLLVGLVGVLSGVYQAIFWSSEPGFPGLAYHQQILVINVGILAVLVALAVMATRHPSFRVNLLFHWLLFAWVGSYAFAWLTE